jgi:hypothetical protein
MSGERIVDPELTLAALSEGDKLLTPREREGLIASLDGASIVKIAARLADEKGVVVNEDVGWCRARSKTKKGGESLSRWSS